MGKTIMAKTKDPSKDFTGGNETDIETKAKAFVINSFKRFSDRSGLEAIWAENDKLYNSISTEKFYSGVANLFPPEIRKATKTLVNFVDETLFSSDPKFSIKGVGGKGDNAKAEAIYAVLDWQQEKTKVRMKLRRMLEQYLVKQGTAIVKVIWTVNEKMVISDIAERNKLKLNLSSKMNDAITKERKTIYDNVDFQVMDIHAMYWNYFKPWEEQKIIIERKEVDDSHLKMMQKLGIYKNIDAVLANKENASKVGKTQGSEPVSEQYGHIKSITGLSGNFDEVGGKKNHEVLEAWCDFDLDGDGIDEECLITVVDGEYVVRLDPNPFDIQEKPYLWCCWDAIEGTSLGQGVPQLGKKSQIALNDFTNQIMDNITGILNCMKVVDDLAEIPDIQLRSRPNGIIHSKTGVDAVKFMIPPNTANDGLQAVAMAKDDIRNATGATMSLQGMPGRYGTTASEYKDQGAASARDVFAKIREIEDRIIKEFLRKAYSYNLQFMSRAEFIKIVGDKAALSLIGTGEDSVDLATAIKGDYDFIPLGVTQLENKITKGQMILNFMNITASLPPGIVDLPKLVQKAWKFIGDGEDILLAQVTDTMISPADENVLIQQGEMPTVKPMENDLYHITVHQQLNILDPLTDALRNQHIEAHQAAANMKQAQGGGGQGGLPPQEQPRLGPEPLTDGTIGRTGLEVTQMESY